MQVPLQITMRGFEHSAALEADIRRHAEKLEQFHSRIVSCRVTVEEAHRHHRQGRQLNVRIDLRVPGRVIAVNLDRHEDVHVAVRDAFDSARRQLEESAREQRGDVKRHQVPQHGTVVRVFAADGCGFIQTGDGRELYFSRENVVTPSFEQLAPGTQVQFIEELAAEGPQAKRVSVGKHKVA
jgi:cold shock CspA family protein/ribosome-associated translation inhibitor RaiA